MSALAQLLFDKGFAVGGCDIDKTLYTEIPLKEKGIIIDNFESINHDFDVLIAGHNFYPKHFLVEECMKKNIPVFEYNEFISSIISNHLSIAICGSHGKTTTVGLLKHLLELQFGELNYLIGDGSGGGCENKLLVFEACEYKNHFHKYFPDIGIILNIDYDHTDFFKSKKEYVDSFIKFGNQCKMLITPLDIESKKVPKIPVKYRIINSNNQYTFIKINQYDKEYRLKVYSNELMQNYVCAIIVAKLLGVTDINIQLGLDTFKGVKRRFKETIKGDDVYIDDYAHHPNQIKVSINETRLRYPNHKIIAIFQPDRYSRIWQFQKEIAEALLNADEAYLLPFPSGSVNDTQHDFNVDIICKYSSKIKMFDKQVIDHVKSPKVILFMSSKEFPLEI